MSRGKLLFLVKSCLTELYSICYSRNEVEHMNHKKIKFRIKELIAEKERKTGQNITYAGIYEATGISPNSLSLMATGKGQRVDLNTLARLLDYFGCDIGDLIVYE